MFTRDAVLEDCPRSQGQLKDKNRGQLTSKRPGLGLHLEICDAGMIG